MATTQSLTESLGVVKRNPVVFVVGLLMAIIVLPQRVLAVKGTPWILGGLQIVSFFIMPFLVAGLLGMVYEGRFRLTSFETFTKLGKAKYISLLAGHLLQAILEIVLGVIIFLAVYVTTGVAAIVTFGVGALVYFAVMFFLQLYEPAIVADNVGPIDGFRRSFGVVDRNYIQTLGFSLVNLLLALLLTLRTVVYGVSGVAVATGVLSPAGPNGLPLGVNAGLVVYSLIATVVINPFRASFLMSFYDNHRPSEWN